ncbi:GDSL-type esterase/lipase family protein [Streptomyces sp. NPDC093094]|uniref:GDSL-type esterase/lipase family protein n=1 Tax=Streptomyces sp. NPDC093094 TaxID=3366026 RepID=UPI0037FA1264
MSRPSAGHRLSALGCVLALLAGLCGVIALPTGAVALPDPNNTWIASQNMQGKRELWSGRVTELAQNYHVVALQEVPHTVDANGHWVPALPSAASGSLSRLSRTGTQYPALPANVQEYEWIAGSSSRGTRVYLYMLRTANHPIAVITQDRAWSALEVQANGSTRNALVVLDDVNRMGYASFHATAYRNNPAPDMVRAIADAVTNGRPGWGWSVIGDFNREPDTMSSNPTITSLNAEVIFPVDGNGNAVPTHRSPTAPATLDYMVTNRPQPNWRQASAHEESTSDHRAVRFGRMRGGAETTGPVALVNENTDLAVTGREALTTPRGEEFRNSTSQIYSFDYATTFSGFDWFHIVNHATGLSLTSGESGVVGNLDIASSGHPPNSFLWRIDGETIRNTQGQRLVFAGNENRLWANKPVPTEPERDSWSLRSVDLNHLDTAGFPVGADLPVYLSSEDTLRYLQEVPQNGTTGRAVEGHLRDHPGATDEKWFLHASAMAGTMYLVNLASGKCLSSSIALLGQAAAVTEACPDANSPSETVRRMSWQFLGDQVWNPFLGLILGADSSGPVTEGTPLKLSTDNSTRYDLMPTGDVVPGVPGNPRDELKKLAVMPLGDSITLGVGSGARTGYRPALARMLAQDAPDVRFVGSMQDADGSRHEGHSGWRIDQISANIERWMEQAEPNLVLLHIGTNDMNRDHQVSTAPQRLAGLIDQIHDSSPNTAIVVASLVPAADRTVQARVDAYNRAIPGIVADRARRGYRITQVSMSTLTVADLDDNLHPNDRGYLKMAGAFHGGVVTAARNKWIDENVTVKPAPPGTGGPAAAGDYRVDVNGDGRSDYLVVEDNGAVRAWTGSTTADGTVKWADQGVIASGSAQWTGQQVRFADVGGDARADYLVLSPNGAVRAFVNEGGDGRGGWRDIGTIAGGSTGWNSAQVRFADVGGDARADYLVVSDRGAVRAFVHTTTAAGAVKWSDRGTVATGSPEWTAEDVRFADVTGDAKADYLVVSDNGAARAYTNTTAADGTLKWVYEGHVATGSAGWSGDQIRFADVTGDARADYLVLAPDGALTAYENTTGTGESVRWSSRGTIATGTGNPATRVRI